MLKHKISGALLALVAFCSANAFAAGFYAGVGAGSATLEYGSPNLGDVALGDTDIDLDSSETAFKLIGGFRFSIVAIEAAYVDFGQVENEFGEYEVSGFSAFGMLLLGAGPIDLFAKTGGFMWQSDGGFAAQTIGTVNLPASDASDDGFDLAYGFGGMVTLMGFSVRAEYEYFNVGDFEDISMTSIGATYEF